ncbi:serine/threonine protein kinase [Heyndrickxia vini]|uniref:non-specific serine/threonine protein kinase n=1 Tax=Heyndrickxia vini TaxID=1476025 RepID=A0ABX7E5E7_9BACI|nr:serine/threonine-protein kinase [Heyndrickxia vini]QQZ10439.1 serine/threonine protein kinase [Heyndrickxia vini]
MAKHNIHLAEGDILKNQYEIIQQIGSGGMSVVYLAKECKEENRLWAIKVADMEKKISKRLFSEAKILSELDHPSLPKIADFFSSPDKEFFYLVQEYVEGETLYEWFEQNDCFIDEETVVNICIQLCDVLHYLHSRKPSPIIYRDLKPANIMITKTRDIKLIDFGIARKYTENKAKDTLQIGTVGFAAPEQFEKRQSDTRTDLFSLGALMYYLLSGGKYVYITQKPIQFFRKQLPKSLKKCIHLLVKSNPNERIQTAGEVKDYLKKTQMQLAKGKNHSLKKGLLISKYVFSIFFFIGVIVYIAYDQFHK